MIVYIEYINRLPGVSVEAFHFATGRGQSGWSDDYAEDQLVLNIARTMRVGPQPEYMAVWYNRDAGLERLGDWIDIFHSGTADHVEEPFKLVAKIERAGCYEALLEPVHGGGGPYYVEYLDFASGTSREAVRDFFVERRERGGRELHVLLDRIGTLGPDPRGLAVWSLPSFGELDGIVRELDGVDDPIRLVTSALYVDLGKEIL